MIKYIKSPVKVDFKSKNDSDVIIFTAGSIDMGKSKPWADDVFKFFLKNPSKSNITILNPRRDSWDSSMEQSIDNPKFKEQVDWELEGMKNSDYIVMNILPDSKSPITLLELGLHANDGKILICCPEGFYRKGNVDIICKDYKIPMFDTLDDLLDELKNKLNK